MQPPKDTIPYGFCHCGCGQKTNPATQNQKHTGIKKGDPLRYIKNHQSKHAADIVVDDETGCWLWQLGQDGNGYGIIQIKRKIYKAHRWYWVQKNGPIPEGMELDHVVSRGCRYRHCVNPDHLEPVTRQVNVQRSRNAKLTVQDVVEIRGVYLTVPTEEIARKFGICADHVRRVARGKYWDNV